MQKKQADKLNCHFQFYCSPAFINTKPVWEHWNLVDSKHLQQSRLTEFEMLVLQPDNVLPEFHYCWKADWELPQVPLQKPARALASYTRKKCLRPGFCKGKNYNNCSFPKVTWLLIVPRPKVTYVILRWSSIS